MSHTNLPPPTRENIERHRRQVKDDARQVNPDRPLSRRDAERVREALHDHRKLTEK